MSNSGDDDEYNYSDEDGYSVEEEDSNMEWERNDNPNAAPMQYKVYGGGGEYSSIFATRVGASRGST
jgi:hypothetical protein